MGGKSGNVGAVPENIDFRGNAILLCRQLVARTDVVHIERCHTGAATV